MIVDTTETFIASDELLDVNYVLPTFVEEFSANDSLAQPTIRVDVVEQFFADDDSEVDNYLAIHEVFRVAEEYTTDVNHLMNVVEAFRARDAVFARIRIPVDEVETFTATDEAAAPFIVVDVLDQFAASDEALPVGDIVVDVEELFAARDSWAAVTAYVTVESFTAQDTFFPLSVVVHDTLEVFVAQDATDVVLTLRSDVEELFYAADEFTPVTQLVVDVEEPFYAWGEAYPSHRHSGPPVFEPDDENDVTPLEATAAWTADAQSWAMSRYVDLPVIDFDAVQFGVGPEGVYTPEIAPVMAFVETGDVSLTAGEERVMVRKRLNYVYTYSRHPEPLSVLVTADYQGARLTTLYTQEDRSSSDTRAVRCGIGRGYASNYIKLRVGGENVFDMAQLEVEVTPTGRRI